MRSSTVLAILVDPDGRELALDLEGWQHILSEHPEMADYQVVILVTVTHRSHRRRDPVPGRERYYRRDAGPSQWVMVIVDFNQTPARIVTAFGLRRARI